MFKEGDIIVGKPNSHLQYKTTNEYAQMMVLEEVDANGEIEIEIVDHDFNEDCIGETHYVKASYFELKSAKTNSYTPKKTANITIPSNDNSLKARTFKSKGLI